ncbi:MAG: polar amino acid transport system substrate-binding protein [Alteromonadaceae bacterium]|jgi:polar amino acid transport system substrate-binding protein
MNFLSKWICYCAFLCVHYAWADTLKVSIPKMKTHATNKDKGVLVDFTKALAIHLKQNVDIQLVPFSRSIYYVSTGKVDFHLPLIKPLDNSTGGHESIIYSDETIFYVNFVLYSHKDKPINVANLSKYKIETESAHLSFFPDVKLGSDCIICSLKKVQYKVTDGYLFADSSTDPILLENKSFLTDMKRQLYQRFEVKVVFPNNAKGNKLNKQISDIIVNMRLSGELDKLLAVVDFPYSDWQLNE